MRIPALRAKMPYHIVNRGVNKMNLFKKPEDYLAFISKIHKLKRKYSIKIAIGCILPNHFHLLLWHDNDPKNISLFMKSLQQSCAQSFNLRYKHSGYVFESRFKHRPKSTARSYANAINYIHNNPVKHGLVERPEDWPYTIEFNDILGM